MSCKNLQSFHVQDFLGGLFSNSRTVPLCPLVVIAVVVEVAALLATTTNNDNNQYRFCITVSAVVSCY